MSEKEIMQSFEKFCKNVEILINKLYKATVTPRRMRVKYAEDAVVPDCDAYDGDVAFDIIFDMFPDFTFKLTTYTICDVFNETNGLDSIYVKIILEKINNTLYQYITLYKKDKFH